MRAKLAWGSAIAFTCLTTTTVLAPTAARADIFENILQGGSQIGTLSFPMFSGTTAAGVDFSLDGFTQNDITSISYAVDPTDLAVTFLALSAFKGDSPCPNGTSTCSNNTASLTATTDSFGFTSCSNSADVNDCTAGSSIGFITIVPVSVPEPPALALIATGLLGLGLFRNRKRG